MTSTPQRVGHQYRPSSNWCRAHLKLSRTQYLSRLSPIQQCQQAGDVMSQGIRALGDQPEAVQTQGVHGQAAARGQDLQTVSLEVAVGDLFELGADPGRPTRLEGRAWLTKQQPRHVRCRSRVDGSAGHPPILLILRLMLMEKRAHKSSRATAVIPILTSSWIET